MRGVFDDEEVEPSKQRPDAELTLGSGTLLAIFFGLVLLCGLCFGMGYTMGHRISGPTAVAHPQPAPEQEPLQASGSIPKPSAIAPTSVTTPADSAVAGQMETAQTATGQPAMGAAVTAQTSATVQAATNASPLVRPALPVSGAAETAASASAQMVHPALMQPAIMVQIAAVSNVQDAEVLVNALRKRNYPVVARRDPADNFIHVRVGPFATMVLAEQWKTKLLNDGYNAIVQP